MSKSLWPGDALAKVSNLPKRPLREEHAVRKPRPPAPQRKFWAPSRYTKDLANQYRLPPKVSDLLKTRLARCRNRDAAFALAVFLGRFHSGPKRFGKPFCIDRRVLALRPDLGLSEAQVRGAINTLVRVGFLTQQAPTDPDLKYQVKRDSKGFKHIRKLPVEFMFDEEFARIFRWIIRKSSNPKVGGILSGYKKLCEAPHLGYMGQSSSKKAASQVFAPPKSTAAKISIPLGAVIEGLEKDATTDPLSLALLRMGRGIAKSRDEAAAK